MKGEGCSRMSDISSAPGSLGVTRSGYRLAPSVLLALLSGLWLIVGLPGVQGASTRVSRMMLLESAGKLLGGRPMTESEALQSGFIEPYSDGKFHLDWPLSRGMAACILSRMAQRAGVTASFPISFSDIATGSVLSQALSVVGKAFHTRPSNRFGADQVFSPDDLEFAMSSIASLTLLSPGSGTPPIAASLVASENVPASFVAGTRFDPGFPRRDMSPASSTLGSALGSDVDRLERLTLFVPSDQLGPQNAFDLVAAGEGVSDMEAALDSFELTIYDVTLAEPQDETLQSEVRDFLSEMRKTLHDVAEKLRSSRLQLEAALLIDPESIRQCAELRTRIGAALFRLERLSERVEERMSIKNKKRTAE